MFKLSCSTSKSCVTNQVLVSICLGNFNFSILRNFVLLCPWSSVVHNLRKRGAFELSYSASIFCVTNQVLVSISIGNCNSPIRSRSWNAHNLRKSWAFKLSYSASKFGVPNQVFASISLASWIPPSWEILFYCALDHGSHLSCAKEERSSYLAQRANFA